MADFELGVCSRAERFVLKWPRSGKSRSKSSRNVRRCWKLKCGAKGWYCKFYTPPRCVGGLTNGIREIVVISINSWTLCRTTQFGLQLLPKKSNCDCHLPTKCPNRMPHEAIGTSRNFVHLFIWRRCRPRWCFCWSILCYIANPEALILNAKWRKMFQTPVYQKNSSGLLLMKLMWFRNGRSIFFIYQLSTRKNNYLAEMLST